MARRRPMEVEAPVVTDVPPVELVSMHDGYWWDDKRPSAEDVRIAEHSAYINRDPGMRERHLWLVRWGRARKRHHEAVHAWCREHGLLDDHDRIDQHRWQAARSAARTVS